jgi:hypothetical protein
MFKYLQILYCRIKSLFIKDMTILAVDVANKSTMTFKNGSIIKTLPIDDSKTVRGQRSKIIRHYDDFDYDEEELDEVLKPYINITK